jgi:purine nucleosidase/pyrimidine-specific ribonucleoside hydrolase
MNAFPDPWRQLSDSFWGISLPPASAPAEAAPAARLIVETIYRSPQPVIVFASGNLTNLAEALRLEPGIKANIREVHIMGGSIHRPGNIHSDWPDIENETAEWNIWVDPAAAQEVFYSGLPLHIIPLDATDQVLWTETDAQAWASGASESGLAVDLLQWMLRSWPAEGIHTWDLTAAISASDPEFCPESPLALDVIVAPGPEQGRTVVTGGAPNAAVCLQPDAGSIRARAASVFGK